ncbi:hypothetical protein PCE1_001214 [Barthelona sp. PCE]
MQKVHIVAARRSALGNFLGSLSSLSAVELGSLVIDACIKDSNLNVEDVDEVLFGNVYSTGLGQNPARQMALGANIPNTVPCTTLNKVCSSGMKSVMLGATMIMACQADVIVAGGSESMSNVPHMVSVRGGLKYGDGNMVDCLARDGLNDAYSKDAMGVYGELCANEHEITREMQDEFTIRTYERAKEAQDSGKFVNEIVPITVKARRTTNIVDCDEEPTKFRPSKIPTLRPVFDVNGTVTAANASSISDGAACIVLVSERYLRTHNLKSLGVVDTFADSATDPAHFTIAPSLVIDKILKRKSMETDDVDLFEINEAFSVVALANMKKLNLDVSRVNVNGGAVALGHPLGCSGARILVTLIHAMHDRRKEIGVAAVCNGGGGASGMMIKIEREE